MAEVDHETRAILDAQQPRIDAVRNGLDKHWSKERLQGPASIGLVNELIADVVVMCGDKLKADAERIKNLEARIEALELHGVKYAGNWQRALGYRKGLVVTFDGGMWTAVRDVAEGVQPGKNSISDWQLSAKRGEMGVLTTLAIATNEAKAATAAATAAAAAARTARAEASVTSKKVKRKVEHVTVLQHDEKGRIARFMKEVVDE